MVPLHSRTRDSSDYKEVPGGTQVWFGRECATWAGKSLPVLKVIQFDRERCPFFRDFSSNIGPFLKILEKRTMFRDICVQNASYATHV